MRTYKRAHAHRPRATGMRTYSALATQRSRNTALAQHAHAHTHAHTARAGAAGTLLLAAKQLVLAYLGSIAASAHMTAAAGAFDALKAAMQARLKVIAAPLERLYVEERLGERLATLGEDLARDLIG